MRMNVPYMDPIGMCIYYIYIYDICNYKYISLYYIHLRIIDAEHLLEKNAKHVGGFMTLKLHKIKKW